MIDLEAALGTTLVVILVVMALVIAHRSPRLAFVAALLVLCFVPVWIGGRLGFNGNLFLPAAVLASLAAALVLLPVRSFRPSPVDALLLVLILIAATSFITGDPTLALAFLVTPFTYFLGGYVLGRIATARLGVDIVYRTVAILFTIVAILAIIEFITGFNPFLGLRVDGALYEAWGDIQIRGGYARAEGAFGHSIALGASLALAISLTLAARFPFAVRLGMVGLMLAASILTFSRIGMICAFLGVALSALLPGALRRRERATVLVGGAVLALVMAPLVVSVFSEAGEEASNSANYRGDLFSLLSQANLVGFSDSVHRLPSGDLAFGRFVSIDGQLVLTALTSGLLALIAVAIALVGAIILFLRGRAQPATIAIIAQLPALATVALITQYTVVLWLVVGVAATSQALARASASTPTDVPQLRPALPKPAPPHPSPPLHTPLGD